MVNVRKTSSGEKRPSQASQVTRGTQVTISFTSKLQVRHCGHNAICPFPARAAGPSNPSCPRHSAPNLLPLPPAPGKTRLRHSQCGFGSRERSRETPGFSATETGKQSLRKRCQGPEGRIFPSKHCKVSRSFTWRSCLGMCLLFLEQQAPYLKRYTHIWCECYHGKCHAFFLVEKKGK